MRMRSLKLKLLQNTGFMEKAIGIVRNFLIFNTRIPISSLGTINQLWTVRCFLQFCFKLHESCFNWWRGWLTCAAGIILISSIPNGLVEEGSNTLPSGLAPRYGWEGFTTNPQSYTVIFLCNCFLRLSCIKRSYYDFIVLAMLNGWDHWDLWFKNAFHEWFRWFLFFL